MTFPAFVEHLKAETTRDQTSSTPLYLRVQRGIEQAIEAGFVEVSDALPAERELAASLGVSRVTVRNAVRALVKKGILVQRHGAGTFVASRGTSRFRPLASFSEDMRTRGVNTESIWLSRSSGLPTPEECDALEIMPEQQVSRLYRLRFADGKPMCLEHSVLPATILPDPGAIETSLYAWLEAHGRRPTRAVQSLSAHLADASQAHLLSVPTGSACLHIRRRSYLSYEKLYRIRSGSGPVTSDMLKLDETDKILIGKDRPIEFVRSYYRGDLYEYVAELHY